MAHVKFKKNSKNPIFENALFMWFMQRRSNRYVVKFNSRNLVYFIMKSQSWKVDLPKIVTEDQILQIAVREDDIEDENEMIPLKFLRK